MSPQAIVVLIVLVDLLGFSIVMPLLPRFASQYGFNAIQIGLLLAAYPLLQLVAGPILGRLSDRYGRRPILILSQAGTAISFIILGLSHNYTVMLLARMLDGASGGNILVAQAYMADVTKPEHRARGMGLIGAAFGVGFVLGPLTGGILLSPSIPIAESWRSSVPFLAAAGFSTIAWLLVLFKLPESAPIGSDPRKRARVITFEGLVRTIRKPKIAALVAVSALVVTAFSALEGTFSLFLKDRMGWNASKAAYMFAYLGFLTALVQGGLIRPLVKRFGERSLVIFGLATVAAGFASIALAPNPAALYAAVAIVALGQGLASPSVQGLISRLTADDEQGSIFGVITSASTLARMINYVFANFLLDRRGASAPFFEASLLAIAGLCVAVATVVPRRSGAARSAPTSSAVASADFDASTRS